MPERLPQSVLFACDHNAVRSPMAEGMMKDLFGESVYVQSVGVINDLEIDGFAIAACAEIGVELSRHRTRSFEELETSGEALSGFDLIVAMSTEARRRALDLTRFHHLAVEYWPVSDPTGIGETRETKLNAYRHTRDQIRAHMTSKWGTR
ncbi:ArsC family transcriptional regulator [Roseivivax halodurans JCM 10272]|uniref:ArsC family transcriptional regulator n=1 Tax=Roseivivax halodurans JCM 10272 TaxID=1449350 RepID=X7EF40_9RHOB|nr:low molecular weight phosphatase family protein [Roseivivax halodurans]ETX14465.1 ArsC family transcriptional regulator [Roseivivax halodurans JCM 10272]